VFQSGFSQSASMTSSSGALCTCRSPTPSACRGASPRFLAGGDLGRRVQSDEVSQNKKSKPRCRFAIGQFVRTMALLMAFAGNPDFQDQPWSSDRSASR